MPPIDIGQWFDKLTDKQKDSLVKEFEKLFPGELKKTTRKGGGALSGSKAGTRVTTGGATRSMVRNALVQLQSEKLIDPDQLFKAKPGTAPLTRPQKVQRLAGANGLGLIGAKSVEEKKGLLADLNQKKPRRGILRSLIRDEVVGGKALLRAGKRLRTTPGATGVDLAKRANPGAARSVAGVRGAGKLLGKAALRTPVAFAALTVAELLNLGIPAAGRAIAGSETGQALGLGREKEQRLARLMQVQDQQNIIDRQRFAREQATNRLKRENANRLMVQSPDIMQKLLAGYDIPDGSTVIGGAPRMDLLDAFAERMGTEDFSDPLGVGSF